MNKSGAAINAMGMKINFPGASLVLSHPQKELGRRFRLGWYLLVSDVESASVRYRCYHFARLLDREFDNLFFTQSQAVKDSIRELDAIVIVKRLDRSTIELAALARHWGKPLFVDLCDDLANPRYPTREDPYLAMTSLLAMASALQGIIVPSAAMAERIEGYLRDNGSSAPPCHVIPDIAETRQLYRATERFVSKGVGRSIPLMPSGPWPTTSNSVKGTARKLVWFGNYGSQHSNFGIFTLKSRLRPLREFHQQHPIQLVIISNNVHIYEALVAGCGFPTRYVPWSPTAVYDELASADAALLTMGSDEFCSVKSSNRIIQALAADVPVITDKSSALAEFEDVVFTGNFRQNLEDCLGPMRDNVVPARQAQAAALLLRYAPERLADIWSGLLKRAIGGSLAMQARKAREGVLLVLDVGDELEGALAVVQAINQTPRLECTFIVSVDLLKKNPAFGKVLHRAKTLPMFFSGRLRGVESQMAGKAAVILGNLGSSNSKSIAEVARKLNIEVLAHAEVAEVALDSMASTPVSAIGMGHLAPPGPYPERTDADGSVEWAFVIHSNARGWILDAICQEIGSRQPSSWKVVAHDEPPPTARNVFFSHFSLLDVFDRKYPGSLSAGNVFVWYTHPREERPEAIARNLELFNNITKVIFTCEANRKLWIDRGLSPDKAVVVLGAADPVLFRRHERGGGAVGLSSSFYERKNPDLLLEVVKALPHREFILLGRHWNRYARFEEMLAQPNFTYMNAAYRDYPRIYSTFDVFLSISSLEGGPIPLIEAMMCNIVPVASSTGFAPDLIADGSNGFLFDIHDGSSKVADLIEKAFALRVDVRETVKDYSWDRFSAEIVGFAE